MLGSPRSQPPPVCSSPAPSPRRDFSPSWPLGHNPAAPGRQRQAWPSKARGPARRRTRASESESAPEPTRTCRRPSRCRPPAISTAIQWWCQGRRNSDGSLGHVRARTWLRCSCDIPRGSNARRARVAIRQTDWCLDPSTPRPLTSPTMDRVAGTSGATTPPDACDGFQPLIGETGRPPDRSGVDHVSMFAAMVRASCFGTRCAASAQSRAAPRRPLPMAFAPDEARGLTH